MTLTLQLDQLVAVMPTLAGHDLSGSLTLATIGPVAGGRRGFRSLARIDIPTKPDDIVEAAHNLLPHVLREDDVDVILAAWETPQAPASPALTGIRLFLKAAGVPVVGCFRVADGTTFDINPDAAPVAPPDTHCRRCHAVDLAGAGPHVSADPSNTRQAADSVQPTRPAPTLPRPPPSGPDRHPAVNRPGMSGDSDCWEGWSHARRFEEAVSGGVAGAGGADGRRGPSRSRLGVGGDGEGVGVAWGRDAGDGPQVGAPGGGR